MEPGNLAVTQICTALGQLENAEDLGNWFKTIQPDPRLPMHILALSNRASLSAKPKELPLDFFKALQISPAFPREETTSRKAKAYTFRPHVAFNRYWELVKARILFLGGEASPYDVEKFKTSDEKGVQSPPAPLFSLPFEDQQIPVIPRGYTVEEYARALDGLPELWDNLVEDGMDEGEAWVPVLQFQRNFKLRAFAGVGEYEWSSALPRASMGPTLRAAAKAWKLWRDQSPDVIKDSFVRALKSLGIKDTPEKLRGDSSLEAKDAPTAFVERVEGLLTELSNDSNLWRAAKATWGEKFDITSAVAQAHHWKRTRNNLSTCVLPGCADPATLEISVITDTGPKTYNMKDYLAGSGNAPESVIDEEFPDHFSEDALSAGDSWRNFASPRLVLLYLATEDPTRLPGILQERAAYQGIGMTAGRLEKICSSNDFFVQCRRPLLGAASVGDVFLFPKYLEVPSHQRVYVSKYALSQIPQSVRAGWTRPGEASTDVYFLHSRRTLAHVASAGSVFTPGGQSHSLAGGQVNIVSALHCQEGSGGTAFYDGVSVADIATLSATVAPGVREERARRAEDKDRSRGGSGALCQMQPEIKELLLEQAQQKAPGGELESDVREVATTAPTPSARPPNALQEFLFKRSQQSVAKDLGLSSTSPSSSVSDSPAGRRLAEWYKRDPLDVRYWYVTEWPGTLTGEKKGFTVDNGDTLMRGGQLRRWRDLSRELRTAWGEEPPKEESEILNELEARLERKGLPTLELREALASAFDRTRGGSGRPRRDWGDGPGRMGNNRSGEGRRDAKYVPEVCDLRPSGSPRAGSPTRGSRDAQ